MATDCLKKRSFFILKLVVPKTDLMVLATSATRRAVRLATSIVLPPVLLISMSIAQQPSVSAGIQSASSGSTSYITENVPTGTAENQLSDSGNPDISFKAHCFCALGTMSSNLVQNFGSIATYGINNQKNRRKCASSCQQYVYTWHHTPADRPQLCTDYYNTGGTATLSTFFHVGTDPWEFDAQWLRPKDDNYPMGCGDTSAIKSLYSVQNVVYAPPGCTPNSTSGGYTCKPGGSIQYTGTTAGSTSSSISNSIAMGNTLTVTLNPSTFGGILPISYGDLMGETGTSTYGTSEVVTKTNTFSLLWPPGGSPITSDGIDHDADAIFILTNPGDIFVAWQNPFRRQKIVTWTLGYAGSPVGVLLPLFVGWLRCDLASNAMYPQAVIPGQPCTTFMPASTQYQLKALGLQDSDLYNIVTTDPYWNYGFDPIPPIPANDPRYTLEAPYSFPYQPPACLNGMQQGSLCVGGEWDCAAFSQGVGNTSVNTSTVGNTLTNVQTYTITAGMPSFLSSSNTITTTNTVSQQNMTTCSNTATAYVGCPSVSWGSVADNPDEVYTYYDAFFGTWLFVLGSVSDPPPGLQLVSSGQVVDSSGLPAPGMALELSYANTTYHASTNKNGNFYFYSSEDVHVPATAQLSVIGSSGTISQTVSVGATTAVALPSSFHSGKVPAGRFTNTCHPTPDRP